MCWEQDKPEIYSRGYSRTRVGNLNALIYCCHLQYHVCLRLPDSASNFLRGPVMFCLLTCPDLYSKLKLKDMSDVQDHV